MREPTDNASERVTITLPGNLVRRIEQIAEEIRAESPYRNVTRSGLIAGLLAAQVSSRDLRPADQLPHHDGVGPGPVRRVGSRETGGGRRRARSGAPQPMED